MPPYEIVVVDGESTDDTWLVVQSLLDKARARWISAPPKGMANARNVAIRATDCEFILPLDADDWIEPTFIERCLKEMVDGVGVVAPALVWPNGRVQLPKDPFTYEEFLQGNRIYSCSLFRRECWEQVGGYDEDRALYEDWLFWGCIAKNGWSFRPINEGLFYYCPHENSSCSNMKLGDNEKYIENTIAKLTSWPVYVPPAEPEPEPEPVLIPYVPTPVLAVNGNGHRPSLVKRLLSYCKQLVSQ